MEVLIDCRMAALSVASKSVNQATAQVVASVKSGQTTLNEQGIINIIIIRFDI